MAPVPPRLIAGASALTLHLFAPAARAHAQGVVPVSRAAAVDSALARGARLAVARADTSVAFAQLLTARALPNPTLSSTWSKAFPTYHVIAELPVDFPWTRALRVGSARAGRSAAQLRFAFERAAAALDADTTYTHVLAARAHAQLSRRNAAESDSLRRMAASRRDAGDASDLDVELATVTAGQAENVASADSLAYLSSLLDLQTVMGLDVATVVVAPTDSLGDPPSASAAEARSAGAPLQVAAAEAAYESATLATRAQRRGLFGTPSLTAGVENGDPDQRGMLPTVGVALPIPLLDRNRGAIAQARAEQQRAAAELALARVESAAEIARARRELAIALAKVARDRRLVTAAERVAAMSLTAYREGASTLPMVLESRRNAREVLAQYVDDLASAWIAEAELRVLELTPSAR